VSSPCTNRVVAFYFCCVRHAVYACVRARECVRSITSQNFGRFQIAPSCTVRAGLGAVSLSRARVRALFLSRSLDMASQYASDFCPAGVVMCSLSCSSRTSNDSSILAEELKAEHTRNCTESHRESSHLNTLNRENSDEYDNYNTARTRPADQLAKQRNAGSRPAPIQLEREGERRASLEGRKCQGGGAGENETDCEAENILSMDVSHEAFATFQSLQHLGAYQTMLAKFEQSAGKMLQDKEEA